METVVTQIAEVFDLKTRSAKKLMTELGSRKLQYGNYDLLFLDLRWIRNKGPSMHITFRRRTTWWEEFLKDYKLLAIRANKVLVDDMKRIIDLELSIPPLEVNETHAFDDYSDPISWWGLYPRGVFNPNWTVGNEIAPIQIPIESHSGKWFVSFYFNPGAFERADNLSVLKEDWLEYAGDVNNAIHDAARRMLNSGSEDQVLSYDDWQEGMIADFGEDVAPYLHELWNELQEGHSDEAPS